MCLCVCIVLKGAHVVSVCCIQRVCWCVHACIKRVGVCMYCIMRVCLCINRVC